MTATKVFTGKRGVFSIQVDVEDGDFTQASEQYESIMDEAVAWQSVCELQKRAKALRSSQVSKEFLKERTRPGLKKALKKMGSSVEDELEFYENQLADATRCRRELICEIMKTSNYLVNIDSNQYSEIYKELNNLEKNQKLLSFADKEVIPSLQAAIRSLNIANKEDCKRINEICKTKHRDKKHGRRVNNRHDQHYKRSRDIARANKNAKKYAFA